jgi:NitT/TauT family transport system permease protein
LVVVLIGVWEAASASVPSYVFPGPGKTLEALRTIFANGSVAEHLGVTLYRITAGFLIAAAIGVPLGILLGSRRAIGEFFEPVLPVMNSISSAVWSLIAVIWFGLRRDADSSA